MTALVRNEAALSDISGPGLTTIQGTPLDASDVEKAFRAFPDAPPKGVVVALNNARTSDSPFARQVSPLHLMLDSHVNILECMKKYATPKIVTLSALGVGDSWTNLFWLMKLLVLYTNLGFAYQDHEDVDKLLKESGVNYVLARPIRFVDGDAKPVRTFGDDGRDIGMLDTITKRSVASFLVDAIEKSDWDGQTPVVAN